MRPTSCRLADGGLQTATGESIGLGRAKGRCSFDTGEAGAWLRGRRGAGVLLIDEMCKGGWRLVGQGLVAEPRECHSDFGELNCLVNASLQTENALKLWICVIAQ